MDLIKYKASSNEQMTIHNGNESEFQKKSNNKWYFINS